MVGIYKITNPNGRVYIGQSRNIEKRFKHYFNLNCKCQPILFNSLNKYGVNNHEFEIIEGCEIDQLNIRERYYQDLYNVIGENGLNCILTETNVLPRVYLNPIKRSFESNQKTSESMTGKIKSEETRNKISESMKGKQNSENSKKKTSDTMKGKKRGPYKKKEQQTIL